MSPVLQASQGIKYVYYVQKVFLNNWSTFQLVPGIATEMRGGKRFACSCWFTYLAVSELI
jgi:hypothetical protein